MIRKKNPNITKKPNVMTPEPIENPRLRKKFIGSIGCSVRSSHITKPTSVISDSDEAAPTTSTLVQPFTGPSMIAKRSAASPTIDSAAPTGSSGVASSSLDRGDQMRDGDEARRRP